MARTDWTRIGLLVVCLALLAIPAAAKAPELGATWAKTYGGTAADTGGLLKDNGDGTFFISGSTRSTSGTGVDALLMKVDGNGTILWQKAYGTAGDDYGAIASTPEGGFAAIFTDSQAAAYPLTIMKLDGSGDVSWQKTYGTAGDSYTWAQVLSGGGFLLSGSTFSFYPVPQGTVRLMKLDASGAIVWQKKYSSPTLLLQSILAIPLDAGGYLADVTGLDMNSASLVALLLRLDASGNILNQKSYSVPSGQAFGTFIPSGDGGVLYEGGFNPDPEGDGTPDILFAKMDASGNITWQKTYGGSKEDAGLILPITGGYVLSGTTKSYSAGGNENALLAKLDGSGNVLWAKTYGGTQDDHLFARADSTGGYLLQGGTLSYGTARTTYEDFWAVKVNETGGIQWQRAYGGNKDDSGDLHRTADNGMLLTGDTSSVGSGDSDIWIWELDGQGQLGFSCPLIHDTNTTDTTITLGTGTGTLVAGTSDVAATDTAYSSGTGSLSKVIPSLATLDACSLTPSLSASASADVTSGAAPLTVVFTGSASGGTGPYSYSWTFGDGGTSNSKDPSHTYAGTGTYNVVLTVTDSAQDTAQDNHLTITVTGAGCILACDASAPSTGVVNLPVSFTSTYTGTGCTGTPTFAWTFGDGQTSNVQNPTHAYASAGTFTWNLTVTLQGQTCSDGGSITVSGGGGFCTVDCSATVPLSGYKDVDVQFSGTSAPSGCGALPIVIWLWTFGDGTQALEQNPTHAYTTTGIYTWTMTVTVLPDGVICYRYGTIKIAQEGECVLVCDPAAVPSAGAPPLTVQFTANAQATDCSGQVRYAWTFGDQSTPSTEQNPQHTYAAAGIYPWTLTSTAIVSGEVCFKSGLVTVSAGGDLCILVCTAAANPNTGGSPLAVDFSASVTATNCSGDIHYIWTFGDLTTPSTEQNPQHTYMADGTYIWNVLINQGNAVCSHTGTVTVYEGACDFSCVASAKPVSGPAPLTVVFQGTSIANNCSDSPLYLWVFGDGGASSEPNTQHTYGAPGAYLWTFTSSIEGLICVQTGIVTVATGGDCTLDCSATVPATGTAGEAVGFTATSLPANCTGSVTYLWTFGDGQTSTSQNTSHAYAQAGTYTWSMTATINGITCSKGGTITISGACTVTCWTTVPATGTAGSPVTFSSEGTTTTCIGTIYCAWNFGDGGTSTQENPTHAYAQPGTYTWTFQATILDRACTKTGSITITGAGCISDTSFPDWKAEYWNNNELSGTPVFIKNEPGLDIERDWVEESPYPGCVNPDYFSVRWTRDLPFTTRSAYRFRMGSDDGSRLFVDGSPDLFSGFLWGVHEYDVRDIYLPLTAGTHRIVMEFFENEIYAHALLQIQPAEAPCSFTCTASAEPASSPAPSSAKFSGSVESYTCVEEPWYHWEFGDGGFSDEANPTYTYAAPGTYSWSLVVTGEMVVCYRTGTVTVGGGAVKPGDCNGDGTVSIGEVQKAINMFLGIAAIDCGVDCNGDENVSIGEVQKVINAFLGLTISC